MLDLGTVIQRAEGIITLLALGSEEHQFKTQSHKSITLTDMGLLSSVQLMEVCVHDFRHNQSVN